MAHDLSSKWRSSDVEIDEQVDFSGLLLSKRVLTGLRSAGFIRPSPIQLQAIPLGRCGLDLIVQAKSGTGKTCVFGVIALEGLLLTASITQVLVLAPTREIAIQICDVVSSIGSGFENLTCHAFIGGMNLIDDKSKLKSCHIAVGTPGRIKHLIEMGVLKTSSIRLFVLDEADKLLDESFIDGINWIYSQLPNNKQMLALSATYPEALAEMLKKYMRNPFYIRLNADQPALIGIKQYFRTIQFHPLPHVTFQNKINALIKLLEVVSFSQCLVFSNYQTRAESLCDFLSKAGWPTTYISGSQQQSQRLTAMAKLKAFQCRILVSTDVTSRGIDAENINLVINMDVPWNAETYLHRIGRAGRFGSQGLAITFLSGTKETELLLKIKKDGHLQMIPVPDPIPPDLWSYEFSIGDVPISNFYLETKDNDQNIKSIPETIAKDQEVASKYSVEDLDLNCLNRLKINEHMPTINQLVLNYEEFLASEIKENETSQLSDFNDEMPNEIELKKIESFLELSRKEFNTLVEVNLGKSGTADEAVNIILKPTEIESAVTANMCKNIDDEDGEFRNNQTSDFEEDPEDTKAANEFYARLLAAVKKSKIQPTTVKLVSECNGATKNLPEKCDESANELIRNNDVVYLENHKSLEKTNEFANVLVLSYDSTNSDVDVQNEKVVCSINVPGDRNDTHEGDFNTSFVKYQAGLEFFGSTSEKEDFEIESSSCSNLLNSACITDADEDNSDLDTSISPKCEPEGTTEVSQVLPIQTLNMGNESFEEKLRLFKMHRSLKERKYSNTNKNETDFDSTFKEDLREEFTSKKSANMETSPNCEARGAENADFQYYEPPNAETDAYYCSDDSYLNETSKLNETLNDSLNDMPNSEPVLQANCDNHQHVHQHAHVVPNAGWVQMNPVMQRAYHRYNAYMTDMLNWNKYKRY